MYRTEWANIPPELRERDQWCYTDPTHEDGFKKAPRRRGGYKADKTNPEHWMSFEEASYAASLVGGHVGYCLSEEDPFTCIDLDVKDKDSHPDKPHLWTSPDDKNRHWKMVQVFNSFTELSAGGKGLHIWLYGSIPSGVHHGATEVYSKDAFIICTGKVYVNRLIQDGGKNLEILYKEVRKQQDVVMGYDDLAEEEETLTDFEVFQIGMAASNAEKFNYLCSLHADKVKGLTEYESNSEADLALLSIFAFYTKSNNQVKRLFRYCPLSYREKSQVNDVYLNRTIMGIRRRAADKAAKAAYVDTRVTNIINERIRAAREEATLAEQVPTHVPIPDYDPVPDVVSDPLAEVEVDVTTAAPSDLTFPPGRTGQLARWILASAKRPLMEVAVASSLALFAGIAGRGWNINRTGLNMYIVLIGRSGIGKEWLHGSISAILGKMDQRCTSMAAYFEVSEERSAQSLSKNALSRKCYLHLFNEWGRRLQLMADPRNGPAQEIRTYLTSLYHKSGVDDVAGGLRYSDKEKNVGSSGPVAYSMVGESTPKTFYEAVSSSMLEDGTMSRYLHIETDADRVALNENPMPPFPESLMEYLNDLVVAADANKGTNNVTHVKRTNEAAIVFSEMEKFCDEKIRADPDNETVRQLYNRASLKSLRVAGLLAVADSFINPVVTKEHADWAVALIMRDVTRIEELIAEGNLGTNEANRLKKMRMAFKYARRTVEGYGFQQQQMIRDGIVPLGVLRTICSQATAFHDKANASTSMLVDRALQALIASGDVLEIQKTKLVDEYSYTGKAYTLLD